MFDLRSGGGVPIFHTLSFKVCMYLPTKQAVLTKMMSNCLLRPCSASFAAGFHQVWVCGREGVVCGLVVEALSPVMVHLAHTSWLCVVVPAGADPTHKLQGLILTGSGQDQWLFLLPLSDPHYSASIDSTLQVLRFIAQS